MYVLAAGSKHIVACVAYYFRKFDIRFVRRQFRQSARERALSMAHAPSELRDWMQRLGIIRLKYDVTRRP